MKVLFAQPPTLNLLQANVPDFVDEDRGVYPAVGALYVAAHSMRKGLAEFEFMDCQAEGWDYPRIEQEIGKRDFDIFGMTALTFTFVDVMMLVRIVRKVKPQAKIVLGGPHVFLFPRETLQYCDVDYLVMGEGEQTFADLLENLQLNRSLEGVLGLAYKGDGGRICINPGRPRLDHPDELADPARELTPIQKYYSLISPLRPITTAISSRGCPYQCTFCDRPHLGKKYRQRSGESVVNEIEKCEHLGIKEIFFYDDTFSIDRDRVFWMVDEIKKRKLTVKWDVRTRVDLVDEEMLAAMKSAGCQRVHFGVEAGSQEVIDTYRKGIKLEEVDRAFAASRKLGLQTLAYFIIGAPGETREQIERTIRYACELNPDYLFLSVLTPFPGTDVYYQGLQKGILKGDYWRDFARNPTKGFHPNLWTEMLTEQELRETLIRAYKTFYARPQYVWKQIIRTRSVGEFVRKARAFGKLMLRSRVMAPEYSPG